MAEKKKSKWEGLRKSMARGVSAYQKRERDKRDAAERKESHREAERVHHKGIKAQKMHQAPRLAFPYGAFAPLAYLR